MSDNPKRQDEPQSDALDNTIKDPSEWVTGDEPATGAQRSYLHTLAEAAGERVPEGLTKAQASELIEALQAKTGRGQRAPHQSER
ncbi:DUF3072 domain-containing protein [Truepera radiovictrix]|uniref:DUF3072 domain-containing protein n=1 Tax=Truepera radiovictrix (strain DSM 17093 / CIP 108686 / LMG 22925 / RQ-24) TaxID=649638 RepID=D7CTV1_TRURR|nr:DUF3072 domain-containing protein [Truepera radiovictrix]ADI15648.1 hypothetical protein Trad_2542 [Truepera radiovictrix DSM 17093]WMT58723.1 DUF3072 domain-containing protein [Truepera radiovictrix]